MTKRQTPDQKRRELEINDRRARVMELFVQGNSYQQIATTLDVPVTRIYTDVRAAMAEDAKNRAELAGNARELLIQRSEQLWQRVWKEVDRGSIRAMEVAVKVLERQAKLYAVEDNPLIQVNQTQVIAHRDQIDRDIATIRDRLTQLQQQPTVVDGTVEETP